MRFYPLVSRCQRFLHTSPIAFVGVRLRLNKLGFTPAIQTRCHSLVLLSCCTCVQLLSAFSAWQFEFMFSTCIVELYSIFKCSCSMAENLSTLPLPPLCCFLAKLFLPFPAEGGGFISLFTPAVRLRILLRMALQSWMF